MKIAFCFFGQPRYLESTFSDYKNIVKDHDVFVHTWSSNLPQEFKSFNKLRSFIYEPAYDTRTHAFYGVLPPEDTRIIRHARETGGLESFDKTWEIPGWFAKPVNATSMWHSMSKSIALALEYECKTGNQYDRIILIRTDLNLDSSFKIEDTFVGDVHQFLMPDYHPGSKINFWTPDHFVSMTREAARLITTLLQSSYHYYYAANVPEVPEILLGFHMLQNGMKLKKSGLMYRKDYRFFNDDGKI